MLGGREKDGQGEGRSWGVKGEQSHPAFVCLSDWECQIMQPEVEAGRGGPRSPLGGGGGRGSSFLLHHFLTDWPTDCPAQREDFFPLFKKPPPLRSLTCARGKRGREKREVTAGDRRLKISLHPSLASMWDYGLPFFLTPDFSTLRGLLVPNRFLLYPLHFPLHQKLSIWNVSKI